MFRFYLLLLNLKLLVLQFVRSVRTGNRYIYIASITNITYFFFALNHFNYARWTPVHIRDMLTLPGLHPEVNRHFQEGRFTINKTGKLFSNIGLDHGQEQISKISNTMADHYLLRICQINFFYTLSQVQKLQTI